MSKKVSPKADVSTSVKFSIVPVILASSCCLTTPALGLLGITFYEPILFEYRWALRVLAILVILLSLAVYFRKHNIKTLDDYKKRFNEVWPTALQTILIAVFFYFFFLLYIIPPICSIQGILPCGL